jgi:hypothetical protein
MYAEIFRQEHKNSTHPADMIRWTIQANRHGHLIKLTDLPYREMKEAMYEAIRQVDCSDGDGLGIEIDLHRTPIPDIVLTNLRYIRIQVNRANLPADYIPTIIQSNPLLVSVIIVQHVFHHGSSYDGNCTHAKVPLLPGQNHFRIDGRRQLFTIPGNELLYRVSRKGDSLKQQWKSYPCVRDGPPPVAEHLPDVFARTNGTETVWSESLLERLHAWENEVKGWMESSRLKSIGFILNTDKDKFGRVEKYWCTCNDKGYI